MSILNHLELYKPIHLYDFANDIFILLLSLLEIFMEDSPFVDPIDLNTA
jgi:hypothetical protein